MFFYRLFICGAKYDIITLQMQSICIDKTKNLINDKNGYSHTFIQSLNPTKQGFVLMTLKSSINGENGYSHTSVLIHNPTNAKHLY